MTHADAVGRLLEQLDEAEPDGDRQAVSLRLVTSALDALPIDGAAVVWGTGPLSPDSSSHHRAEAVPTTPSDLEARALSVLAFPLHDGPTRIGMLDLYRSGADEFDSDELGTARTYADAASAVLVRSLGARAPALPEAAPDGAHVHQATGMVAVQLSTDLAEAIIVLREAAFVLDRSIDAVARDVIRRILRFA